MQMGVFGRRFTLGLTARGQDGRRALFFTIVRLGPPDIATHWAQLSIKGLLCGRRSG